MSKCKCHDKLIEAKADLEYTRYLPVPAFQTVYGVNGSIIRFKADIREDAIKMKIAIVKRLEVLAKGGLNND